MNKPHLKLKRRSSGLPWWECRMVRDNYAMDWHTYGETWQVAYDKMVARITTYHRPYYYEYPPAQ